MHDAYFACWVTQPHRTASAVRTVLLIAALSVTQNQPTPTPLHAGLRCLQGHLSCKIQVVVATASE
jgi:hypothetical protein